MEARLILEDGSLFRGFSRGARGETWGEVVFNTSMTGYQEILTTPHLAAKSWSDLSPNWQLWH